MEVDGLPTVDEAAGLVTPDRLGTLLEFTLYRGSLFVGVESLSTESTFLRRSRVSFVGDDFPSSRIYT